jgi:hypothetical protein
MATVYKFSVTMPVTDVLPRNRISNTFHMQHVIGSLADTDLEDMCNDILAMWTTRMGISTHEIVVKAYDTDAVPNYPRATAIANAGSPWLCPHPREVALCLSYAGSNRGNKSERGRMFLMPSIAAAAGGGVDQERPNSGVQDWALDFYRVPNASLPDLGGVDWQFGVWSTKYKRFTQTKQAWVNDEWDTQRSRGLRETSRVSVARDG